MKKKPNTSISWQMMAMGFIAIIMSSCTTSSDSGSPVSNAQIAFDEVITVNSASNESSATPLIGFVHGISPSSGADYDFPSATQTKIVALAPTFWKVSDWRHYAKAKRFNALVMFASADAYFNYQPIYYPWNNPPTRAGTLDDWVAFNANAVSILQSSLMSPARPVDYWGIVNEPQFSQYSPSDQARLLETFGHGYHNFKDQDSHQKVVGPGTIGYNTTIFTAFLNDAVEKSLKYDAITWHELGTRPEDVVTHVNNLQSLLAARSSLGNPPIIIDEYASAEDHHLPGFAVAWFYYLEKAGVSHASRACWDVQDSVNGTWSDCWDGLDGLFMKDNLTPQALYWVFERYAHMRGNRLTTTSTAPTDVIALASAESTASEQKILVGRFSSKITAAPAPAKNIKLEIDNLAFTSGKATVQICKIPYNGPDQGNLPTMTPLTEMIIVATYQATVEQGSMVVSLPGFKDRDAYYVTINPK
jgi:hypothetical protein